MTDAEVVDLLEKVIQEGDDYEWGFAHALGDTKHRHDAFTEAEWALVDVARQRVITYATGGE